MVGDVRCAITIYRRLFLHKTRRRGTYAALHKSCDRSHNGSVLFCPGCRVSQAVTITANPSAGPMPRWRGQCLECDHAWDFDDE
jgi:hypothetical protein